ncbi:MAG TPA: Gfo/Idh/MocA family oxidoreductase [Allosphingosinicella sp.]|nr:Gfo/Idh/MocA family oxidoreductase [Allosphingosinicella sp.]
MPIRVAIIGYGKIARDQHVPSIAADPRFALVAVASRNHSSDDVPSFSDHRQMFRDMAGEIDAIALCTPPTARLDIARDAFAAGLHVLLEKPPAATLGEVDEIERLAGQARRTLFASWHSQHAAGVAGARKALSDRRIRALDICWHEDVRKWHPGQEWIWAPGGFGVFDPGINALSIATRILPMRLFVRSAGLVFPANRQTPIAAQITFAGEDGALRADFDWRCTEGEKWTIRVETAEGTTIELLDGGARLAIDGQLQSIPPNAEYPALYAHFAELVETGGSNVDKEPLRLVADSFLTASRTLDAPFE